MDLKALPEEYFANDGVVPVFSQWHPGACWPGVRCVHHPRPLDDEEEERRSPDIFIHGSPEDDDEDERHEDIVREGDVLVPPAMPPKPVDFGLFNPITTRVRSSSTVTLNSKRNSRGGGGAGGGSGATTNSKSSRELPMPNIFHVYSLPASSPTNDDRTDKLETQSGLRRTQRPQHHHLSIMPLWAGTDRQRTFWREVGGWLEDVDDARAAM